MGTRGCVGWRTRGGNLWGVYNHFDSYPTGLGVDLWGAIRSRGYNLETLVRDIKKARRWENLINGITSEVDPKERLIRPNQDPLFIEWIYVLDPKRKIVEVWTSRSMPVTKTAKGAVVYKTGAVYVHRKVIELAVGKKEPNWKKIEEMEDEYEG